MIEVLYMVVQKNTIEPHGGKLINRELTGIARKEYLEKCKSLSSLNISKWIISDMEMISNGGFSPLIGFMGEKDYQSVLKYMHLANGLHGRFPLLFLLQRQMRRV